MFTDTHCHLFKEYYDDINLILIEMESNGINRVINNGCDRDSNEEVIESIKKYSNVYGAIGIHPEYVDNYTDEDIKYIEEHINDDKVVAIGEIGLDYHYTKENKDRQIELFEKQLSLAMKYNKPVIIHCREAIMDTLNVIKKYKVRGVIHGYTGSLEIAREFIKLGFLLGVNGVITFKNCNYKDILKDIGMDKIVLETDSPYLTPVPYRGKKNSPTHVIDIAKFVCNIYGISLEELSKQINLNIYNVYKI